MDIDYLLDHFADGAGDKEEIALIIYYLEKRENDPIEGVTQSDVKEVIRNSRSAVNTSSVSTYFSRLKGDWISESNGNSYILTHDGKDGVQELLADDALDFPREEDDRFIDSDIFEEDRYKKLIEDINDCYRYRIYDGTMVLSRKLFEDLVFEILKTHYAGEDVQMFYNQEDDCHYSFNELLNNLKEGVPILRRYSRELDDAFVEEIRDLKNAGNRGAHSIRVDFTDGEVEEWSSDATRISEVLYDVLLGARIADQQEK
jgi:hypothetical protein